MLYLFSVHDYLWPVLNFLIWKDAAQVAQLCRISRDKCTDYCLQWDRIDTRRPVGRFRFRWAYVYDTNALSKLPPTLQALTLWYGFDRFLVSGTLPPTLQSLTFGGDFNQSLASGILPPMLRTLTFGFAFDQPLAPGVLPPLLQALTFGCAFNRPLAPGVLP